MDRIPLWRRACAGVALFLGLATALSAHAGDEEPDRAALAAAGRATRERLTREPASWSVTLETVGVKNRRITEVVSAPGMKRIALLSEMQGRIKEENRIVARDGVWYYFNPGGASEKWRPYEAPFGNPFFYLFVAHGDLHFVGQDGMPADLGTFESIRDGVATYRRPLAASARQLLLGLVRRSEGRGIAPEDRAHLLEVRERFLAERARPANKDLRLPQHFPPSNALEATHSQEESALARDWLEKGLPTRVDIASGMLLEYGRAEDHVVLGKFQWLERADPQAFAIEGKTWADHTTDPTRGDCNDLVMMGSSRTWQPGRPAVTDARLFDLWSSTYRRVPFHGPVAIPGCFLKDRTRVVVLGYDPTTNDQRPYEVNLSTGENRRLGGDLLALGTTYGASVSPDGSALAVIHRRRSDPVGQERVCRVDLKTGQALEISEPGDYSYPSWLNDGQTLLLSVGRHTAPGQPRIDDIARMDLGGNYTKIIAGKFPTLLADGKTILFRDEHAGLWKTCDLDGTDVNRYADGLEDFTTPALAPDGQRLLMIRLHVDTAPEPMLLLLGQSDGESITRSGGLWNNPVWR